MNRSLLISAALAGLMLSGCASSQKASTGEVAAGECHGVNSCKGTGECGGAGHSCAGKNSCKGQGWVKVSKAECAEKGGKFKAGM
ncbi:MAG: hypothetical protein AB7F86_07340 [Bdellovibrionales bacterium]